MPSREGPVFDRRSCILREAGERCTSTELARPSPGPGPAQEVVCRDQGWTYTLFAGLRLCVVSLCGRSVQEILGSGWAWPESAH
eukprot:2656231-Pyramimonas_sp.AAC.1